MNFMTDTIIYGKYMYDINDIIGKTNWYAQISIRLFHKE